MGLLKHFILPLAALMHGFSVYCCMDLNSWSQAALQMDVESEADVSSKRQLAMLGALRAFNACLFALCSLGVVSESAHFRGVVVFGELIIWAVVLLDAYTLGFDWTIPVCWFALMAVGTAVHAMEPGVFTKDKAKAKSS
mmetsp:Transcript_23746/g.34022  ORF Transcript_23746/g.34022 Transcript_23746/m.34022 type:complete len:139 (-) Transcript_23746:275-691(-)|eukprot:CAMPEP_0202455970 /NCGR_PEP_ID=MMETSP1360-20130828/13351_1 /ASSEMBLY_ACC=CAM_ASM_000848 /TAXON_ID=515479 /ORGANISM="Licmophora paradoxa, Strain CCMP2313" /LENGTH=138 /DNA_ID=CAMNT_0049075665 /DNA_START=60 /DNA_END=476 /DNA_ORIENTATION=-